MIRLAYTIIFSILVFNPLLATAQSASTLPLLNGKRLLGTTLYGSASASALSDPTTSALIDEGIAQGMNGFTFYEDWTTLEPEPGVYELDELEATLQWLEARGITPYLNITVVDIDELNLFDEWLDDEGDGFADSLAFNDVRIVGQFKGLLDQVIPLLLEYGGFYLGVGNEVDSRYATEGPLLEERTDEFFDYLEFVAASVDHARLIEPDLAIGVTVTSVAPLAQDLLFEQLLAVTDVLPVDYYGLKSDFSAEDLDRIPEVIALIMEAYENETVIVQETGCISTEAANSSPELQGACMDVFLSTFATYPQVKMVSVFSLYDLDEPTCQLVTSLFGVDTEPISEELRDRIIGFLCDPGMVLPDGTPKPAWTSFLNNAGSITSTSIDVPTKPTQPALEIYPNPVRSGTPVAYNVSSVAQKAHTISVYDILGRTIEQFRHNEGQQIAGRIASDLPPGIYFVRIESASNEHVVIPFHVVP